MHQINVNSHSGPTTSDSMILYLFLEIEIIIPGVFYEEDCGYCVISICFQVLLHLSCYQEV